MLSVKSILIPWLHVFNLTVRVLCLFTVLFCKFSYCLFYLFSFSNIFNVFLCVCLIIFSSETECVALFLFNDSALVSLIFVSNFVTYFCDGDIRQGVEQNRDDGDLKLNDLMTLSKKVMAKSSSSGQEIIVREVERCKSDWSSLLSDISQVCAVAVCAKCCLSCYLCPSILQSVY